MTLQLEDKCVLYFYNTIDVVLYLIFDVVIVELVNHACNIICK